MVDTFDKAWKKLLKARYMSDISSEESDIEKAKRKERAKKMTNTDFVSFNDGSDEIPLPSKSNTCANSEKTILVKNRRLQKVRYSKIILELIIIIYI